MITLLSGNGRVLLTVNGDGEWNRIFYPYAGQFQHLRESRLGLYDVAAGRMRWLRAGDGFRVTQDYVDDAATARTRWEGHGLEVEATDQVHPNHDLVIRRVRVRSTQPRELRLFAYHALNINESTHQDTAYLDQGGQSVVHYKRITYCELFSEPAFDAAVCGEHTYKSLVGSWVDAEDGKLDGGTIAHGAADSILQWNLTAAPGKPAEVRLFAALGRDNLATARLRGYARTGDPLRFEREAHDFWKHWLEHRNLAVPSDLGADARALYHRSVYVMRACVSHNGAIIASPDTRSLKWGGDTYNFCWGRDAAYIAKAMDECGLYDLSHRWLHFAESTQHEEGYWAHRHFPDGTFGSTWHPPPFIQVDQTASVVSAAWHHFKRREDIDLLVDHWPMVKGAANFLTRFRHPDNGLPDRSWDLWEERLGIHAYSTATVVHALERAARIAEELGKEGARWRTSAQEIQAAALKHFWDPDAGGPGQGGFVRTLEPLDRKVDASILLALKLGLLSWDDPRAAATVDLVERKLWVPGIGGLSRYEGDRYYGGQNPWVISTLWLAEAHLNLGRRDRARELIRWVVNHASATGLLPEQLDKGHETPASATPLAWSHATFVDVVNKYRLAAVKGSPREDDHAHAATGQAAGR